MIFNFQKGFVCVTLASIGVQGLLAYMSQYGAYDGNLAI